MKQVYLKDEILTILKKIYPRIITARALKEELRKEKIFTSDHCIQRAVYDLVAREMSERSITKVRNRDGRYTSCSAFRYMVKYNE